MRDFRESETKLRCYLKSEKRRTLTLIVAFLILGILCFGENVLARDLRNRVKEENSISIESRDAILKASADGIDVIDISAPDSNGISRNKFIDLSVGIGNGVIFNNSTEHGKSKIGGKVLKNLNLEKSAVVILNEVTGNSPSNISGDIEVFGDKADFILANENGIFINNAVFINANGVTLTTGKVTVNESKFKFDIQRGEVTLNEVENDGDYFNVYAKTIEVQQKISAGKDKKETDITMVAGENILQGNIRDLGKVNIVFSKGIQSEKYGIYGTNLGAMYGQNIKLISTDSGLGVRHDGLIFSTKDIEINSNGDIVLSDIKFHGTVITSGKNVVLGQKSQNLSEKVADIPESINYELISQIESLNKKLDDNTFEQRGEESSCKLATNFGNTEELRKVLFAKVLKNEESKKAFAGRYKQNPQEVLIAAYKGEYMDNKDSVIIENAIKKLEALSIQEIMKDILE